MVDVPVSDPTYTLASYDEPTREGYMFCGWSTSSTGAVQYRTNDQITLDGNLTLYAVWDDNPYIITLNTNYDGGVFKSILVPRNHPNYTLTSRDEPTHTEYTFIGWSQSPTGVVDYRTGNKVTLTGNLTFYAVWGGTVNSLTYTITDEEKRQVELFEYEGDKPEGILNIPATVTISGKEFSVTSIGNSVFSDCSSLQSVTIPNSVTNIGDNAFSWCEKLQSVIIPESVTRFGNSVFWACTSLRSVTIPNSVTTIGEECFRYCTSLQSIIILWIVYGIVYTIRKHSNSILVCKAKVNTFSFVLSRNTYNTIYMISKVNLHRFRKDKHTIYSFLRNKAYHAVSSKELV